MKKILIILVSIGGLLTTSMAQGEKTSTEPEVKKAKYTKATFRSTRIINMQSVEILPQGNLQFMISHHFGELWNKDATSKENLAQMFGLNSGIAHTYLSLDYSVTNKINLGLAAGGKSNFEGWTKIKLLRQQTGLRNIPVSLTWFSLVNVNGATGADINGLSWNRYSFLHQLLIARKFSDRISLQVIPSWIHYNIVPYGHNNSNEVFSLGIAGKYKISSNKNFTFEYANQLNMHSNLVDKNGNIVNYNRSLLSLGMEFDTGGHLFQLYVGSTTNANNIEQLSRNTSSIKDGNFALGFTINRGFNLKK
jgi:Membrane bound beta barrel domain (DUF5777)